MFILMIIQNIIMKKFGVTLSLILSGFILFSQESIDTAMMSKIKDEALNRSQIVQITHQLTDVAGPRLTNSPGFRRAADYAVKTFKEWNFTTAMKEPWGEFGKGWSNEKSYFAITAPYFRNVIAYPVAWTKGTQGAAKKVGIVLLDKFDSASINAHASEIKGNVVMLASRRGRIRSPFDKVAERHSDSVLANMHDEYMFTREEAEPMLKSVIPQYNTMRYLEQKGAVAFMMSGYFPDGTVAVQGSVGYAKGFDAILPNMMVSAEDYLRIERLVKDGKKVEAEIDIKNSWYTDDLKGYNVIGEIAGSDPALKDQVVMIGGHLDSWHGGTGATDNAAGCAVMMEAMRILKALGVQPKRTIRIALWDGEEQGLLGSFGYVKKHFGNPIDMKLSPEQSKISVYYNLDNGTGKIRGIFSQGNEQVADIFTEWLAPFNDMDAKTVTNKNTGSTDHLSLDAVGIPAFEFIQDPIDYETRTHHTNMDVYDHLQIDDLKQAAAVVAGFVYNSAMRKDMIPRKPLPKAERFIFDFDLPL